MIRTWKTTVASMDLLALAFTAFNSLRTVAYLPTLWTLLHSGQSDQHALSTWLTWCGANATMAAWVWRHNGRRLDRIVLVNVANAVMCGLTVMVIVGCRLSAGS